MSGMNVEFHSVTSYQQTRHRYRGGMSNKTLPSPELQIHATITMLPDCFLKMNQLESVHVKLTGKSIRISNCPALKTTVLSEPL